MKKFIKTTIGGMLHPATYYIRSMRATDIDSFVGVVYPDYDVTIFDLDWPHITDFMLVHAKI